MKIDLHTHSETGSGCSRQSVDRIVCAAMDNGLDAVCLTDHNNTSARQEAAAVSRRRNFPVFVGMEVTVEEGDLLVFGPLPEAGFGAVSYRRLRRMLDATSFALIPAHPFRGGAAFGRMPGIIRRYAPDFAALELCSFNMTAEDTVRTRELAADVGRPLVTNSDSHVPERPAGAHYNVLTRRVHSVEELVQALNAGAFEPAAAADAAVSRQCLAAARWNPDVPAGIGGDAHHDTGSEPCL